jgi:formylglycine-generating enzyme required for sulfatase activity
VVEHADRNWRSPGFTQNDRHPVVCVNWADANAYVAWLSKKTSKTYRLTSEAEREYVTRAGTTTAFWWGATASTDQANYNAKFFSCGRRCGLRTTVAVDTFKANPWGLYNVHCNLLEWLEDCWNDNAPVDGRAQTSNDCSVRAARGDLDGPFHPVPVRLSQPNYR